MGCWFGCRSDVDVMPLSVAIFPHVDVGFAGDEFGLDSTTVLHVSNHDT